MMVEKIDITMTAVIRPAIIKRTLSSIREKICGDRAGFRLILNVDPIGEKGNPAKVVKIAKQYFDDVIFNIPNTPSFSKAVKWVWANSDAPFIFHIEDDWTINRPIDVAHMIRILRKHKKLSSLRLYKLKMQKTRRVLTFGCRWIYNEDGFYLAKDWRKQFGLNPILIKREFINQALPKMKDDINPEKQFRYAHAHMRDVIKKWTYGIYSKPGQPSAVTDIGRNWIRRTSFSKPKTGTFLTWEKK